MDRCEASGWSGTLKSVQVEVMLFGPMRDDSGATDRTRRNDGDAVTAAVTGLVRTFGRYGHKRIAGLLEMAG